jgi:oxaloacetate decarboxylase alpha subunit
LVDDVLTYALFPQIGLKFLENRDNPDAFEPPPWDEPVGGASAPTDVATKVAPTAGVYNVRVNGKSFTVEVAESGALSVGGPSGPNQGTVAAQAAPAAAPSGGGDAVKAALAGNIFKVNVAAGAAVKEGDPLLVVEAMKMETVVPAPKAGTVTEVFVAEGDKVAVGDPLVAIG